ncbi:MAG: phosphatase PAP2 family protein [bacterium]|nr:phosphatase PAP2 family protein [bacterium]
MKLSWSHKLFLKINQSVGKNPRLDSFMYFSCKWLIYFISLFLFVWVVYNTPGEQILSRIIFFIIVILCSYSISLIIGGILRKPRPEVEIPEMKQLVHTIALWKSFPSDHTSIGFLMIFLAMMFGLSVYLLIPLLLCAGLVAVGRVYCGVHYPRDIVGGFILAIAVSLFVNYFFI